VRASIRSLRLAVAFLTIVPVGLRGEAPPLGTAAGWFPSVGAIVGALAAAVGYLLRPLLGANVAAVLAVGVLVAITGALHQDGLADCADGLGARRNRERRLAIMRDSSIGAFGALALLLWLALVAGALSALGREEAFRALVVAVVTGRWAALLHSVTAQSARLDGLGAGFVVGATALAFASVTAAVVALALAGVGRGLVAIAVAAAVALLVTAWSRSALGGRTGDTLGATVALSEVAVALALLATR